MVIIIMKNKFEYQNHPLMVNNITRDDLDRLIIFLKDDDPILTQSSNVKLFEEEKQDFNCGKLNSKISINK